jgi:hypothetical protein
VRVARGEWWAELTTFEDQGGMCPAAVGSPPGGLSCEGSAAALREEYCGVTIAP